MVRCTAGSALSHKRVCMGAYGLTKASDSSEELMTRVGPKKSGVCERSKVTFVPRARRSGRTSLSIHLDTGSQLP